VVVLLLEPRPDRVGREFGVGRQVGVGEDRDPLDQHPPMYGLEVRPHTLRRTDTPDTPSREQLIVDRPPRLGPGEHDRTGRECFDLAVDRGEFEGGDLAEQGIGLFCERGERPTV
jgi:hypothetical protein